VATTRNVFPIPFQHLNRAHISESLTVNSWYGKTVQNVDRNEDRIGVATSNTLSLVEVIDLDHYEPQFCTCDDRDRMKVPTRVARVVFALPAIFPFKRQQESSLIAHAPEQAVDLRALEDRRIYYANRYKRLRESDLKARDVARASPRRSPRLLRL